MSETQPIRCLAIANRGEAAMRCIRAVKSLGALEGQEIRVVALYTEPDRTAPFVRHADVAIQLPIKTTAVAAYLDHDLLVRTLRRAEADAVWPGWGFVAEDPAFVDRVTAEGIRFLGPSANTMRALGDKISSKHLAERARVPVTAWSKGVVANEEEALRHADRIGYPVVIKASAGGGGRGIRVVHERTQLGALFKSAASEAQNAFGDGRLFVEQMVRGGRHIEVQIVADQHGNVIALGSRDCSVQRRHQKVLEEAPPIGLLPAVLKGIKQAAVRLASDVGYYGVGTVEFLVQGNDYFFLEMNPRLQVEHGITEELTSTDLVQLQIRIARGEKLPNLHYEERGYSIEARVCAEDPDAGFLPAPGRIARFDPALGTRLRVDTGVASESVVPADFDSLIAKVIASGDTREEARARLVTALRDFDLVIQGGATNKSYLLELLETEAFRQGGVDTGWLDRWNEKRTLNRPYAAEALVLAAILSYQRARETMRFNFYLDAGNITPDKIPPSVGQQVDLSYDGKQYKVGVYATGVSRHRVHMDGQVVSAQLQISGEHAARLRIGGRDLRVLYDVTDAAIRVEIEGNVHKLGRQTAGQVRAGAPSMVVAIAVAQGEQVKVGQRLGLLEAMKMEIGFDSPIDGTVTEIRVRKGQQVAAGDVMLVIDPAAAGSGGKVEVPALQLPAERDPLAVLFKLSDDSKLDEPDLERAARAGVEGRRAAMLAVNDEIRRIVLGYDAFEPRVQSLIRFLEAPIPEGLPLEFLTELCQVKSHLGTFADIDQLFVRTQPTGGSGELEFSNNALVQIFVRRMRAQGAGLSEAFLGEVRRALAHYEYNHSGLEYSPALERAVLRLFASQLNSELRSRLILAVLRRISALSEANLPLSHDEELRQTLVRIASLRGHVSDQLADAVIDASYRIFERPELAQQAERISKRLEHWFSDAQSRPNAPPSDVLGDLALLPPDRFHAIRRRLRDNDSRQSGIALAAYTRRLYAPKTPTFHRTGLVSGPALQRMEFADGRVVLSAMCGPDEIAETIVHFSNSVKDHAVFAFELVVPLESFEDWAPYAEALGRGVAAGMPASRVTLSVVPDDEESFHISYVRDKNGVAQRLDLHGLHPETAERIDFHRYQSFELERIFASPYVYCFYGKSRQLPEDERIFVMAEVRVRPPEDGPEAEHFIPSFERTFYEAARALRTVLSARDPRRRLQWNRITVFIGQPVVIDPTLADNLARKLHPATRHLGLERVAVRVQLLDAADTASPPKPIEVIIADLTGNRMDVTWRDPHTAPLAPVTDYVRRVVAAKRRGLIYPYEIIRMLAADNNATGDSSGSVKGKRPSIPRGQFQEYDLDPQTGRAISVADREPGKSSSAVVFGVISTPTVKVPEGMSRVLILSDPTRDMGALAMAECDRVVAALDLAEQMDLPVEWLPVSSGARIAMNSGTENLDATARVVRRIVTFTQKGGVIHIIVAGVNVGAQSYWDSLATMLLHTRGVLIMTPHASMVLTGRAALAASGSVSAEDEVSIGGFERVMGPNGQAQYFADDLADAYRILYDYYSYSYVVPGESGPRALATADPPDRSVLEFPYSGADGFAKVGEIFDPETNPGRKKPFAMRALMTSIIDQDGGHLERWQAMAGGETAIVWDAHLGGNPVCFIGIESQNVSRWGYRPLDGPVDWNGGTLFPQSSKKVARALTGASGNRPAVIIANLSGFDGSPESMRKLQLEYGAEIARAVVNFEGPILFLVVSRYHGGAYVVFSRELNPSLRALAVEGSYASVIGGGPAAAVVFPREVQARVSADERVRAAQQRVARAPNAANRDAFERLSREIYLEKQTQVAAEFDAIHSVDRAKQVKSLEDIIPANGIRSCLIGLLRSGAN
ncbi:MAG TPA: biotin carboxylase N-terminal domain-containing protein [Polyangiaceae bacterium]|nr:biotin carboxylase N-terminal domain-containing protein [Polyangiaceae bacterium]